MKHLEGLAKRLLAIAMAGLLFRPRRRPRLSARLARPNRVLLVRPDNRVGEALLMTPLLTALKGLVPAPRVDVLLHAKVKRVLEGHPALDRALALDRRGLGLGPWAPGIRALRRERYDVVVDCGNWEVPSITSALIARLAAPHGAVIGPDRWPVSLLHDASIQARPDTRNEVLQRLQLLSPLLEGGALPEARLSFRAASPTPALEPLLRRLSGARWAVVNPGGRLGWRCVPPEVFAAAAREISRLGLVPVITWGPGEEGLAAHVEQAAPGSALAPATSLDELAVLMRRAAFTVCNNTGPMHLSVAVGTPTIGLFLHMEVDRWGHPYPPHRMLDLTAALRAGTPLEAEVVKALGAMASAGHLSTRAATTAAP